MTKVLAMFLISTGFLGYVVYCAIDLELALRRGGSISFEESPILFCIALVVLMVPALFMFFASLILFISVTSERNSPFNKKIRASLADYEKAKREAEEYNS